MYRQSRPLVFTPLIGCHTKYQICSQHYNVIISKLLAVEDSSSTQSYSATDSLFVHLGVDPSSSSSPPPQGLMTISHQVHTVTSTVTVALGRPLSQVLVSVDSVCRYVYFFITIQWNNIAQKTISKFSLLLNAHPPKFHATLSCLNFPRLRPLVLLTNSSWNEDDCEALVKL